MARPTARAVPSVSLRRTQHPSQQKPRNGNRPRFVALAASASPTSKPAASPWHHPPAFALARHHQVQAQRHRRHGEKNAEGVVRARACLIRKSGCAARASPRSAASVSR